MQRRCLRRSSALPRPPGAFGAGTIVPGYQITIERSPLRATVCRGVLGAHAPHGPINRCSIHHVFPSAGF